MFDSIPTSRPATPLLDTIDNPEDLRQLPLSSLDILAQELRHFLLYTVGQTGGHFGAGLGVVELTIALHYVFNTPDDALIWDVGHQTYPHKILTGRRELMHTLRQPDGIAPFPSINESTYDVFGTGHSSTSISAALGIELANRITRKDSRTLLVIGDGAMTAGQAFEAINHVAACQADVLIVLNDNAMSISENVGGLANYFANNISASRPMHSTGDQPSSPGSIFTDLGFSYTGPVDGHDLPAIVSVLESLSKETGPRLLHVLTRKGKGYAPAESEPANSHSLTKLEKQGINQRETWSAAFGSWLTSTAGLDPKLVAITPAMKNGSGMAEFARLFPDRFHDVAIAEQHAVTLAAGLAAGGAKPVVAIYSTFLQRAYDQLIHDVAIQQLDVLFAVDRASLLEDGPTHAGVFDISFTRAVPGLVVMTPSCRHSLHGALTLGYQHQGPALVRYPRGALPESDLSTAPWVIGRAAVIREGSRAALLCFGPLLEQAIEIAGRNDFTVVDMRFAKPLDETLVRTMAGSHQLIVTIEENTVIGGAGGAVAELLARENIQLPLLNLGVPDEFTDHGSPDNLLDAAGLSEARIEQSILNRLE